MVHMPAINTPPFDWCESLMDRHPQPVPPIYQPEVVAREVVRTVVERRRSTVVGSWNRLVVAAGRFVPGFGNHYAAFGAWDTQLEDRPAARDRRANLFEPQDRQHDVGARGAFDDRAGGFWDRRFLRSLPAAATTFVRAARSYGLEVGDRMRWRLHRRLPRRSRDRRDPSPSR